MQNSTTKHLKEGAVMDKQNLKIVWIAHENEEYKYQRYLITSAKDAEAYFNSFDNSDFLKRLMKKTWMDKLAYGTHWIIATDEHPLSGFPTYCGINKESKTILEILNK